MKAIATVGMLLAVAGCAVITPTPQDITMNEVPQTWSVQAPVVQAAAASDANASGTNDLHVTSILAWWRRFNDPLLSGLIDQTLQHNTDIVSARAALRQARALRDVATAALWPSLGATASAQQSRSQHANTERVQAGLSAQWDLDLFGNQRSAWLASEAGAQASAAMLADVQVSMATEVALVYITLRSAQTRLLITQDNLVSQQETWQITAWRQQAGLVTSLDALQARAATEQTDAQIPTLRASIDASSHALAVLAGRAPAALLATLRSTSQIPRSDDLTQWQLPAQTLRQRADVRAAEWQVRAAIARLNQAESARLPKVSVSGSWGASAATLGALTHGASVVGSLLGNVTMPLFDGGAGLAQVNAQQAALEAAESAYQSTILLALKEVEDALVTLRGNRQRLSHLGFAADVATLAAQTARQQYDSGLVDFQTVLTTQRTQLDAQSQLASAQADVSSDQVRLYQALGGGWEPDNLSPEQPIRE